VHFGDEEWRRLLTPEKVRAEVAAGGRFVFFECCVSLLFVTWRRPSAVHLLRTTDSRLAHSWPHTLVSLLFGWWGIPWGVVYTPLAVLANLRGGRDVTEAVCALVQDVPSSSVDPGAGGD
jgi:hypothetical protein